MAIPQTSYVNPVQIPTRGLNRRDPLATMTPDYCPWMLNFDPEPQTLKVRRGIKKYYDLNDIHASAYDPQLVSWRDEKLFMRIENWDGGGDMAIYDITDSSAVTKVFTPGTFIGRSMWFSYASGYLGLLDSQTVAGNAQYSGGVITPSTPSWSSFAFGVQGTTAMTYKGRVYIATTTTLSGVPTGNIGFSALAAVAGSLTDWPITSLFEMNNEVVWMATLTSSTNTPADQYFCFGNTSGEILVYAGDNPAAANWEQVGKFKVGRPLGRQEGVLEISNDIWIVTEYGVVSIRALLQFGSDNVEAILVSSTLTPYFTELVRRSQILLLLRTGYAYASIAHWPERNLVFVGLEDFIDSEGEFDSLKNTIFVYNTISQAWSIYSWAGVTRPKYMTYFQGALYFSTGEQVWVIKEDSGTYEDENNLGAATSYPIELESAYTNLANSHKNKQITGFDTICKTDFADGKLGIKAASDFGRKVSATSYAKFRAGYNNPFYAVGVQGEYVQYRWSGTSDATSTTGFELYSMGIGLK